MPELKRNFLKGRMNKDLDERIIPNGEYRHALNVEVGTSEGGDSDGSPTNVGSLQTIMGNSNLSNIPFSGTCVGSIADEKNDTLYWFVSSQLVDIIARYDQRTGSIDPVVVDRHATSLFPRALNFNANNLITGINIVDDMLFWTDNNSEPKKINIPKSLAGNPVGSNFTQHTTYVIDDPLNPGNLFNTGIPIQEKHITVIKENPVTAPVLEMKNTAFTDKVIEGQISGAPDGDFTDSTGAPLELGDIKNSVEILGDPDFKEGDILLLTSTATTPEKTIRVKVDSVVTPQSIFDLEIMTIHVLVTTVDVSWDVKLEQRESFFDFKFPRFAVRYKYDDGEYSAFGPFSEVAFLPGEYDYQPKKGFNLGMVNQVRHLAIKDFIPEQDLLPDGVIAIDILYKESDSPNVYTVKTVKPDEVEWSTYRDPLQLDPLIPTIYDPTYINTKGFLEIESEMIHAVLPSNQLLRPWDNVPRKALAQEITGNRLVYGNYLQNYNVHSSGIALDVETWREVSGYLPEEILPEEYESYTPAKSVKSLRTYQLGVVFRDIYGRETPVFSNTSGQSQKLPSVYLEKQYADRHNILTAKLTEPPPSFAESFKFYIKETSNEYYNLAMDRWYDAQDDNIWLSFPSSERNKVDIETFLILKKARDSGAFVSDPARYKILAIENEAPIFIKTEKQSHGTISDNANKTNFGDAGGTGFPLETYTFIYVAQSPWQTNKWDDTLAEVSNPLWVRMKDNSTISQWYRISSISHDTNVNCFRLNLKKPLEADIAFTSTNDSYGSRVGNLVLEIMEEKVVDKAEFEGRFFVKVYKDITLMNHIVKAVDADDLWIVKMAKSVQYCSMERGWEPTGRLPGRTHMALGAHNGPNGTHEYPEPGRWGSYTGTFQPSGIPILTQPGGGPAPITSQPNLFDHCGGGSTTCIMGGQGITHPSFYCSSHYSAFGYVTSSNLNSNERVDLVNDAEYGAGNASSSRRIARDYWSRFSKASSGWFIDGWVGLQHAGDWEDCDPDSGGGNDQDMFPTWRWRPEMNGRGMIPGSNTIEISFHKAGKNGTLTTDHFKHGWYSSKSHDWATSYTVDYMALEHSDTASEVLFKESLITPGTLWRWRQDPDKIIYKTTADYGKTVKFNHAYYCFDGSNYHRALDKNAYASNNRRQQFRFTAAVHLDPGIWSNGVSVASWNIGEGTHKYLPTNDPRFACIEVSDELVCFPHLEWSGNGAPASPILNAAAGGGAFTIGDDPFDVVSATNCIFSQDFNPDQRAPGIRSDGMPSGHDFPGSASRKIGDVGEWAGTVTWELVEAASLEDEQLPPTDPAVWETEPKEDVGLDIYYEIGQVYPVTLDEQSNEQYIPIGSTVECWRPGPGGGTIVLGGGGTNDPTDPTDPWIPPIRVAGHNNNEIFLVDARGNPFINNTAFPGEHILPGDSLIFRRADGSATAAVVQATNSGGGVGVGDRYELNPGVWDQTMRLPWFNCYSFGNGVESDRIRDDFNQVTIDNGPKASTTLDEPYLEERRSSGFIWSGIYNSISGVNNLNQFVQAEPITKDLNPSYGSIQKIFSRNTDLVTFCEDKVLKVLANKDALYNADGSMNLTATANVLGQTTPFAGEFGISKNPESFANEAYRLYFSDVSRGTTCRLSQNGITPISEAGMQDWFADKLPQADKVIGSFDDKKQEYNVSLLGPTLETLSFSEVSKGWTSFKSFTPENGISFNNDYYTFKSGQLYQHHINTTRNNFYGIQYDSSVNVLFNDIPGSVKSFNTLNYEGTQARITELIDPRDPEYYNNIAKDGWFVDSIYTNLQEINEDVEFKSKEGKWFAQVKGESTNLENLDTREFSVQGIGNANSILCPQCPPPPTSWNCISNTVVPVNDCDGLFEITPPTGTSFASDFDFLNYWTDPANGYSSRNRDEIYACVQVPQTDIVWNARDICLCGDTNAGGAQTGILFRGMNLSMKVYDNSISYVMGSSQVYHSGTFGSSGISSYSWDDFLGNIINDWSNWNTTDPCPVDATMNYDQANNALVTWEQAQTPIYHAWSGLTSNTYATHGSINNAIQGSAEMNYCNCSLQKSCECEEVQGAGGMWEHKWQCLNASRDRNNNINCCNPCPTTFLDIPGVTSIPQLTIVDDTGTCANPNNDGSVNWVIDIPGDYSTPMWPLYTGAFTSAGDSYEVAIYHNTLGNQVSTHPTLGGPGLGDVRVFLDTNFMFAAPGAAQINPRNETLNAGNLQGSVAVPYNTFPPGKYAIFVTWNSPSNVNPYQHCVYGWDFEIGCGGSGSSGCLPCSDPNADTSVPGCCNDDGHQSNYNPLATCYAAANQPGACIPNIYGCMDCGTYWESQGTNPNAPRYCNGVSPATTLGAINYYAGATVHDQSMCVYPVWGCTDSTSLNYNPLANIDDGSC